MWLLHISDIIKELWEGLKATGYFIYFICKLILTGTIGLILIIFISIIEFFKLCLRYLF